MLVIFPQFFFYNEHNRYLFGLNPAYAYARSPERYLLQGENYYHSFPADQIVSVNEAVDLGTAHQKLHADPGPEREAGHPAGA